MARFFFFIISIATVGLFGAPAQAKDCETQIFDCGADEFDDLGENHPLTHILRDLRSGD